jgi:hypothetical protein
MSNAYKRLYNGLPIEYLVAASQTMNLYKWIENKNHVV